MPSIFGSKKQLDVPVDVKSSSSSTSSILSDYSDADIKHGKTLLINAQGIGFSFVPHSFSKQLEIPISDVEGNVIYMSRRFNKKSNSAVLSDRDGDLIATRYFWGPGRDPKMHFVAQDSLKMSCDGAEEHAASASIDDVPLGDEIQTKSKWTSATHRFTMPNGREFQWHYAKDTNINKSHQTEKEKMLIFREMNGKQPGRRIAQLVRNNETRTPGTKKIDAGNGGELIIDMENASLIVEPVIVASCMLMLKKEIDRRRDAESAIFVTTIS